MRKIRFSRLEKVTEKFEKEMRKWVGPELLRIKSVFAEESGCTQSRCPTSLTRRGK